MQNFNRVDGVFQSLCRDVPEIVPYMPANGGVDCLDESRPLYSIQLNPTFQVVPPNHPYRNIIPTPDLSARLLMNFADPPRLLLQVTGSTENQRTVMHESAVGWSIGPDSNLAFTNLFSRSEPIGETLSYHPRNKLLSVLYHLGSCVLTRGLCSGHANPDDIFHDFILARYLRDQEELNPNPTFLLSEARSFKPDHNLREKSTRLNLRDDLVDILLENWGGTPQLGGIHYLAERPILIQSALPLGSLVDSMLNPRYQYIPLAKLETLEQDDRRDISPMIGSMFSLF